MNTQENGNRTETTPYGMTLDDRVGIALMSPKVDGRARSVYLIRNAPNAATARSVAANWTEWGRQELKFCSVYEIDAFLGYSPDEYERREEAGLNDHLRGGRRR